MTMIERSSIIDRGSLVVKVEHVDTLFDTLYRGMLHLGLIRIFLLDLEEYEDEFCETTDRMNLILV